MPILKSDVVCCPNCKKDLQEGFNFLFCEKCTKKYPIENGIIIMISDESEDLKLSIKKWDKIYYDQLNDLSYYKEFDNFRKLYSKNIITQFTNEKIICKDENYLEIGCGQFFLGQELANVAELIIGIDICPSSLLIAKKMLDEKKITNYILIQGDILNLPIKNNVIDFVYGGGVIEHFKDTQKCINELYRCLKIGGVSFNTVPFLNIGSLTYRQIWGNIPNLPILKQLAEFIHIKLLKGRHMIFGYEFSFTSGNIKKIHKKAGFKKNKIKVEKFEVDLVFEFIPTFLRKYCIYLAKNCFLFWPMIKIIAKK